MIALALAVALGATDACHTIADIPSLFAPEDKVVSYTFRDTDAHKIIGALILEYGKPPGNVAVTAVLAFVPTVGDIFFYLFDAAGCYTAIAPEIYSLPMVQQMFDVLDITLPIGATFYQLPGIKA